MRRILTVFIASPSDLADERKRTFDVVAEVNEVVKNIGWSIDLLGWEDTLPGYGRPQALINRDVERCDLFIGILWRRWGTPPALDSPFSSGFEEEFSVARKRRERTPSPEIWMFFKKVESAQLADAGAQLQRVIAFRESLIAGKTVFFRGFDSVGDWEKTLRECLFKFVFSGASVGGGAPEGTSRPTVPAARAVSTGAHAPGAPAVGDQIAEIARTLAPAFDTGDLGDVAAELGDANEIAFLAVRSVLLSAALVSVSGTSEMSLPIHELNTLYRFRDRLRATRGEIRLLFRTLLGEDCDVKPGWFWFRDDEPGSILRDLVFVALFEQDGTVRARAFEILRRTRVSIFDKGFQGQALERSLGSIPADIQAGAWAYLVDVATHDDVDMLRELASNTWLEGRVEWLQAWVEMGRDLNKFLPTTPDPQLISEPMKELILAEVSRLSEESLRALRSLPIAELREAALTELRARGLRANGDDDTAGSAVPLSMLAALSFIPNRGLEPAETDEQQYARLSREGDGSLQKSLDWYELDAPVSYRLLVERGEIPREVARNDLRDGFRRIRGESYQRLERAKGSEAAAGYNEVFEKYQKFITRMFTAGALTALAAEPTVEDVPPAREFLGDSLARLAALRIIASAGDGRDAHDLIEIARSSYGDERKLALGGVTRLAADRLETARRLLASEAGELRRAALPLIGALPDEDALPFLEELLLDADEGIRVAAVACLRNRVGRERLTEILWQYIDHGTYFYNVVAWLDRIIYAPAPLSSYYGAELDRESKAVAE